MVKQERKINELVIPDLNSGTYVFPAFLGAGRLICDQYFLMMTASSLDVSRRGRGADSRDESNPRKWMHYGVQLVTVPGQMQSGHLQERRVKHPYTTDKSRQHRTKSASPNQKEDIKDGDWEVTVTSISAAENADVILVVYGNSGNSGTIVLGTAGKHSLFLDGEQDQFKINLKGVGKIFKIRLELHATSTRRKPYWKPKEVKLRDLVTREVLKFKCPKALSYTEGDGVCEMAAVRPGQQVLPVVSYLVQTHTAAVPGAETDANVFITLFGDRGDTGKRPLIHSDNSDKFLEGQVDTFRVEAMSLGPLKRLLLSHDGEGPGEGWKCTHITVQDDRNPDREVYVFNCNRWMDTSMDDGRIERLLPVTRNNEVKIKGGGRDRFFHRLTGDRAGGILPFLSTSENSDIAFNKKFFTNRHNVQYAVSLSHAPIEEQKYYDRDDVSHSEEEIDSYKPKTQKHNKNKMAGYAYLKLPMVDSPRKIHSPGYNQYTSDSDDNVTLPDIDSEASSLVYRANRHSYHKQKSNDRPVKKYHDETDDDHQVANRSKKRRKKKSNQKVLDDGDLSDNEISSSHHNERYRENRKSLKQQHSHHKGHTKMDDTIDAVKQMEDIILKNKAARNNDLWSDVASEESEPVKQKKNKRHKNVWEKMPRKDNKERNYFHDSEDDPYLSDSDVASVFSTASGVKLLRNVKQRSIQSTNSYDYEPAHAVYIGSTKLVKKDKTMGDSGDRSDRNKTSPQKIRHEKHHPLISKKTFPWESRKQVSRNKNLSPTKQREKPKTAVVRPTQRQQGENEIAKPKVKKEEVDPLKYLPHRIEVRLAERRMRRRKRDENGTIQLPEKKSRLRKWSPKRPHSRTFNIYDTEFQKKEGVRTAVDIRRPRSRTFTIKEHDFQKKQGIRTDVDIRKPKERQFTKKKRNEKEVEAGDYTDLAEEKEMKLPSAIEERIRARQLRRKNRPITPIITIKKDDPWKIKRVKRLRLPPVRKPLTVPIGPFTGASRIEERLKAKKDREEQKKQETEALLARAEKEKKKPKPVEMAPKERKQPHTYGEKHQIRKEAESDKAAPNKPIEVVDSKQLMDEFGGNGHQERLPDEKEQNLKPPRASGEDIADPSYANPKESNETPRPNLPDENKNNSSNQNLTKSSSSDTTEESNEPVRRKKVEFNLDKNTHGDYVPPPILRFGEGKTIPSPRPTPEPVLEKPLPLQVAPSPSPDFKPKGAKENPAPWAKRSYIHDDGNQKSNNNSSGGKGTGKGAKNWRKLRAVYYVGKNRFFHDYKSNIEYLESEKNHSTE